MGYGPGSGPAGVGGVCTAGVIPPLVALDAAVVVVVGGTGAADGFDADADRKPATETPAGATAACPAPAHRLRASAAVT